MRIVNENFIKNMRKTKEEQIVLKVFESWTQTCWKLETKIMYIVENMRLIKIRNFKK